MFDFWKFYEGLSNRVDYFDNYWEQFPKGNSRRFMPAEKVFWPVPWGIMPVCWDIKPFTST